MRTLTSTLLLISTVVPLKGAEPATEPASQPAMKLHVVPKISLSRKILTTRPAEAIPALISSLNQMEHPYFGICPTYGSWAFAPLPNIVQEDMSTVANHDIKTPPALVELVAAGPAAIPHLLKALDDKMPTKLTVRHEGMFGAMWYSAEVPVNQLNPADQASGSSTPLPTRQHPEMSQDHISAHTVTIGDVCFVALGQIVNRSYMAMRYQWTACTVINSPVHDRRIIEHLRRAWASDTPEQHLLDSLLLDYATYGSYEASELQVGAATRLLYFYPDETATLIARRLKDLQVQVVGADSGPMSNAQHWQKLQDRDTANGVSTEQFVKAVAWCKMPVVRTEIRGIFERTTDPQLLLASLSSVEKGQEDLVLQRVNFLVERIPADDPVKSGYRLLTAVGQFSGERAKSIFQCYMATPSVQRCENISLVLRATCTHWASELLLPLLDDKRETGRTYAPNPNQALLLQDQGRLPIRVCDVAAETISQTSPDLPFVIVGDHGNLDEQIAKMKARITSPPS